MVVMLLGKVRYMEKGWFQGRQIRWSLLGYGRAGIEFLCSRVRAHEARVF